MLASIIVLLKKLIFLYYSSINTSPNQIILTSSIKVIPLSKYLRFHLAVFFVSC